MNTSCIVSKVIAQDRDGYPRLKHNKRMWRVNRLFWTLVYGDIPEGLVIGHKCNNTSCINIEHLYITTPQQNSTDAARDLLYKNGKDNHKTKRTDGECLYMWELYHTVGYTQQRIGDMYGISQSRVSEAIRRGNKLMLRMNNDR